MGEKGELYMYTLLIADDEPLIRNGVKKIIDWESLGFSQIFLAEDGQEALDIIKACGSCADRYCDAVYGWAGTE